MGESNCCIINSRNTSVTLGEYRRTRSRVSVLRLHWPQPLLFCGGDDIAPEEGHAGLSGRKEWSIRLSCRLLGKAPLLPSNSSERTKPKKSTKQTSKETNADESK